MRRKLLLIDDDMELANLLHEFFAEHGYVLDVCHDGEAGLRRLREEPFELVLPDIMLPKRNGFAILRDLRQRNSVPVPMLTAVTDQASRIAGLEGGADDYLPKPFDPVELLARIHAILRRARLAAPRVSASIRIHGIQIVPGTRTVWKQGTLVPLTAAEFEILNALIRHAGQVVARDDIAQCVYQRDATPFDRWIDVHISRLRKKL
jgi:two-component system, OmpR family, response regulator CpxR